MLRSAGESQAIEALRKASIYQKSDERNLGDSDFVENVLANPQERLEQKYALAANGIGFEQLALWASQLTWVPVQATAGPSKRRQTSKARSLICFWAGSELGMSLTALAHRLGISVPSASLAAQIGEQIIDREKLEIRAILNVRA